jgi:succinate dehydrogenase flavin-adding protein (antitoxin of CptAB toxin-antitoxin module)
MVLALVVIGIFPAASIYAWQMANKTPENARVEFRVVINGLRELDVLVHVNVNDGLTKKEAEQIAEETFIQVLGENVINRLDKLTLNENSMEVHYTWGIDESDMGHVFDMTVDITSRSIIVTHCR